MRPLDGVLGEVVRGDFDVAEGNDYYLLTVRVPQDVAIAGGKIMLFQPRPLNGFPSADAEEPYDMNKLAMRFSDALQKIEELLAPRASVVVTHREMEIALLASKALHGKAELSETPFQSEIELDPDGLDTYRKP